MTEGMWFPQPHQVDLSVCGQFKFPPRYRRRIHILQVEQLAFLHMVTEGMCIWVDLWRNELIEGKQSKRGEVLPQIYIQRCHLSHRRRSC